MTFATLPAPTLITFAALCLLVAAGGVALVTYQVCNWAAEIKSRSDAVGLFWQIVGTGWALKLGVEMLRAAGLL